MIRFTTFVVAVFINEVCSFDESSKCSLIKRPEAPEVPTNKTAWTIMYRAYDPIVWHVPCKGELCDTLMPDEITFKKVTNGVDRRRAKSCFRKPSYMVSEWGYPLNPAGRTGREGRGMLPKWGPNHMVRILLHKKDEFDWIHMRFDGTGVQLPEYFVNKVSGNWFDLETEKRLKNSIKLATDGSSDPEKIIRDAEKRSKSLLTGSIPHPMNTDHAWVEIHIRVINCNKHEVFCNAFMEELKGQGYTWIDGETRRFKNQYLANVHAEFDIRKMDSYSAFCKAIAMKSILKPRAIGVPLFLLPIYILIILASIAATSAFGGLILIIPIAASVGYAMALSNAASIIIPRRCR